MEEHIEKDEEEDGHTFGDAVDADSDAHVLGSEETVILANVGFVEELTKVGVGATEAAVEDACKGGFGIATVGRGVVGTILGNKFQQGEMP